MKSQSQAILTDLARGRRITPLDALRDYDCFRLSARIHDLRKQGHNIKTEWISDPRTKKSFAEYYI